MAKISVTYETQEVICGRMKAGCTWRYIEFYDRKFQYSALDNKLPVQFLEHLFRERHQKNSWYEAHFLMNFVNRLGLGARNLRM